MAKEEQTTDFALVTREGPICVLTMSYPARRNAMSLRMREALMARLQELMYRDKDCRAIVLIGAGNTFSAGGDLSEMKERTILDGRQVFDLARDLVRILVSGPKPVIAAVEGSAFGMGLSLACACDYVVADRDARMCAAFVRVGLMPDTGILWTLVRRVGAGKARELMMLAKEFDGSEASRIGMANQTAEPGKALALAKQVAHAMAALPPLAVAYLKAATGSSCDSPEGVVRAEVDYQSILRHASDRSSCQDSPLSMANGNAIELTRQGAAAVLSFAGNLDDSTFPHALAAPLCDMLRELNADNSCRCIVFSLTKNKTVSPAASAPPTCPESLDLIGNRQRAQAVTALFRDLLRGPKPIVGAVEGAVRGAGLALVAACDEVIATEDASFCCDALGSGLLPDMGLLWNLPQRLGAGKAKELFLLGNRLDAREAQRACLVTELAPSGQALNAALSAAKRYEELPLVALALLRASLVNGSRSFDEALRQELDLNSLARESPDHPEAIAAFMEKRKPNFTGN